MKPPSVMATHTGTQGRRLGWQGCTPPAPVLARTEKPSSLAHAEVETSFLPEAGDFLREGRLQHPCFCGKNSSRGSHKAPSLLQGSPNRWPALAQLPAEALVRMLLLKTPAPWPIASTRHIHSTGKRPRQQNLFLWSDKGCQMGCQHT